MHTANAAGRASNAAMDVSDVRQRAIQVCSQALHTLVAKQDIADVSLPVGCLCNPPPPPPHPPAGS